jgi:hypothetical protein
MNEPTPVANPQPAQQPQPMQTGKSRDPFKMWLVVVAVLFLAAGGFAVWQTMQLNEKNAKVTTLESTVSGLETELAAANPDGTATGDTATDSDSTKILAAVDAYVRAPVAAAGETFEYNILENENGFARVNVSTGEGGGYAAWLKKVSDNWTVLVTGQDMPTQETIDKYNIPESVLQ